MYTCIMDYISDTVHVHVPYTHSTLHSIYCNVNTITNTVDQVLYYQYMTLISLNFKY